MDERKSVYVVVDDEQMTRVRSAMEDVTSLVDSLRLGCEIAYRREPTQEEGDAYEHHHDQSMGASHGSGECFVPMGSHHGWKCKCGTWVWGGPTVCQRCVDADAVKIAMEWKAETDRLRKLSDAAGGAGEAQLAEILRALEGAATQMRAEASLAQMLAQNLTKVTEELDAYIKLRAGSTK